MKTNPISMQSLAQLTAILVLVNLASCQKEQIIPTPPPPSADTFHTIRFRAIVDTNGIAGFVTERAAFFPHEYATYIHTATFSPAFGNLRPDVYSPHSPMNDSMYRGVQVRWGINVVYRDSFGYPYGQNYWVLPIDTIDSKDDTLIIFRWPEDTLRAEKRDWITRRPI
ncbi:MAG TPA: hypothetical protein VFV37_04590 [Luteibaculaceae bacterium]|nr:hypothetical protein [Luteibaculaceae bacterium]